MCLCIKIICFNTTQIARDKEAPDGALILVYVLFYKQGVPMEPVVLFTNSGNSFNALAADSPRRLRQLADGRPFLRQVAKRVKKIATNLMMLEG